jgi:hypothetical protein
MKEAESVISLRNIRKIPSSRYQLELFLRSVQSYHQHVPGNVRGFVGRLPVSSFFSGPSVPEHSYCDEGSKEHHDSHSIFWFSYSAVFLGEAIDQFITCSAD